MRAKAAALEHQSENDASVYADAVATYLAFAIDKVAEGSNSLCTWSPLPTKLHVVSAFGRQALPMVWDYAESNPLGTSSGNVQRMAELVSKVVAQGSGVVTVSARVEQRDAVHNNFPENISVSTDPPYYDNIGYADLSDFFYVWQRQSLRDIWPELFRKLATPKSEELIASPFRHQNRREAEDFFMRGMRRALTAMVHAATDSTPLTIFYAFKQGESSDEGLTSAGWASFLQAIVESGLAVDGTWPVRTERAGGFRNKEANALASSIVPVCRKRSETAASTDRARFTTALRRELPDAIAKIRAAGVGPVDMQQSVIGPGMGVFTRFAEVLEDDDSTMPVKTALTIINRVWEELDNELVASLDAETQVALAWFGSYGFDTKPSGELITMANAKNTSINTLFDSGVFMNLHGKTQLTPRDKLPAGWTPSRDRHLTVWECVQHTARTLNDKEAGGQDAAARLVAEMGPLATDARALLDRLFRIATDKGWASEALVYNQLAEEWPHLLERARAPEEARAELLTGDIFTQA
jgi:putative DNA methylase